MRATLGRPRWAAPLVTALVVAVQILYLAPARGQDFEVGVPINNLRGSATGIVGHAGALESGGTRAVDSEIAWSGAVADADADGVGLAKLNEVNRIYQPKITNKLSYARGSGVEVGLGTTPADPNQAIIAGLAEQTAPPDNKEPTTEEIAVEGDPVAYASVARGQAIANSQDSGLLPEICVLGDDLARGIGYAADAQLVDSGAETASPQLDGAILALDDQDPDRSVSQSTSRVRLVPSGKPNNYGLMSEVRQTIAPVTLLQNRAAGEDPRTVTIEVLGEWVLRVVALGSPKGASVFYGPGKVSPQTPILRIIDSVGEVSDILSFQDLFGEEGTIIPIPGLAEIALGEDPRAIAKPGVAPDAASKPTIAADGTTAAAAVDVIRIRLADGALGDIRVGHMEVTTQVPAGGVNCPIPVTKTADPRTINIVPQTPNTSKINITVHNVFDCDLVNVVLTDRIRQREGDPDFKLLSGEPTPESPSLPTGVLRTADVVWKLGDIPKGTKKSVSLDLQSATKGGIIRDIAEAVGKFANCVGHDVAGLAIAGLTVSGLSNPVDIVIPTPLTGASSTRTAATGGGLSVGALAAAVVLRRRSTRRT